MPLRCRLKEGPPPLQVAGTGLGGRVTEDDVLSAAGKPAASASSAPAASSGAFMREAPDMPDGDIPRPMCCLVMHAARCIHEECQRLLRMGKSQIPRHWILDARH
jgi:pyruvate/2-oxoglutarate dehydrogenase complex dihydrolipoamide acyltransferase (E2) component